MSDGGLPLKQLLRMARDYEVDVAALPIAYENQPYTRIRLHRTDEFEVMLICFAEGQTSSVHDHRGSRCVVRVVQGLALETHFHRNDDGTLRVALQQVHPVGAISGLEGDQVHQICTLDPTGTVLLNFYSPPFGV